MSRKRSGSPNVATNCILVNQCPAPSGAGVVTETPLSKKSMRQVGALYVDDTNLWAGLRDDDDVRDALHRGQEGNDHWGGTLMAAGGDLNPNKCFYAVHDMVPGTDGTWVYRDHEKRRAEDKEEDMADELDDLPITIPQNSGEAATITRLRSDEAVENLGLFARLDGCNSRHLQQMKERIEDWTKLVRNGELPTRSVWQSYTHQLWAGLKYGLEASLAPLSQLRSGLGSSDFYLLSSLGITRSITKEWRHLPSAFCGMGLYDITTETSAATINMMVQHYGTDSALGITLQASLENLQLELGVTRCPLHYNFKIWDDLASHSWVKALWEKTHSLKIEVSLDYPDLVPARKGDRSIMELLVERGIGGQRLQAANRVRKHQEAIFLSCISTATGTKVDEVYLRSWKESHEGQLGRHRSTFPFGKEFPLDSDWATWEASLQSATLQQLHFDHPLRRWVAPSPRIWRYFQDTDSGTVEVVRDDGIEIYSQVTGEGAMTYELTGQEEPCQPRGQPALVLAANDDRIKLRYTGPCLPVEEDAETHTFIEYLKGWGGVWMWEDLMMTGDPSWLKESMERGTLLCCTDGSYDPMRGKQLSEAGWIIFCRESGQYVSGAFVEKSNSAGSYRGEMLGMLAIHLFLLAVEKYCTAPGDNHIFCDNKGAIYTFQRKSKRLPAGAKNADVQCVLRRVKSRMKGSPLWHHMKAHQDDKARRDQLSLPAQLNCYFDDRAKQAIADAIVYNIIQQRANLASRASCGVYRWRETNNRRLKRSSIPHR